VVTDDDGKPVPLNAGSRGMARDPADIYEQRERRSCAGCVSIITIHLAGTTKQACGRNKPFGRRCRFYVERTPERPPVR
jgi:hypothetical protein